MAWRLLDKGRHDFVLFIVGMAHLGPSESGRSVARVGNEVRERDYDQTRGRPRDRLFASKTRAKRDYLVWMGAISVS